MSTILRQLGALVIDADQLAREVVAPGTLGLAALVEEFGPSILTEAGELDRPAMARRVFGDEPARRRLEGVVHPLVFEGIQRLEAEAPPDSVIVHDIALLAESGRADTFDAVLVVDAPTEVQVERMVRDRNWSEEEALSRVAAQASRQGRLEIATHVVENIGSCEDLRVRVEEIYADLTRG